MHKRRRRLMCG